MTQASPDGRLFLRRGGVVLGPFTPQQLENLRAAGEVPDDAEYSKDKLEWRRLTAPAPLPPPAEDAPEREPPPATEPAAIPIVSVAFPPPADRGGECVAEPETAEETSPRRPGELLGDTLAMLWESSDFLRRIRARGVGAALWSAFFALLFAFGLTALALGLFAARYNEPPELARTVWIVLAGVFLFFEAGFSLVQCFRRGTPETAPKVLPEVNLLTAAFGTFQLAFFLTLMLALAFLRNPLRYRLPPWGDAVLLPVMAAGAVFFLGQTLTGFRLNLMTNLGVAPERATRIAAVLLWGSLTATGCFLIPRMIF